MDNNTTQPRSRPTPKDDRVLLSFRITETQRRAFRAKAAFDGVTVQEILSEAVERYLTGRTPRHTP